MDALLGPGEAEAAAGEIALMLLLTDAPSHYGDLNTPLAEALAARAGTANGMATPSPPTRPPD
jgi:hypothetical protein